MFSDTKPGSYIETLWGCGDPEELAWFIRIPLTAPHGRLRTVGSAAFGSHLQKNPAVSHGWEFAASYLHVFTALYSSQPVRFLLT
jgi:hypothetical protein